MNTPALTRARARSTTFARSAAALAVPSRPAWGWSVALAGIAFAAYAWGAGTVAADKDSSEFTLVLATLGIAHPTGYPLYTVLGHLFGRVLHAIGIGWPQAAALWSALGGAIAVGGVHAIAARLLVRAGVAGSRAALVALLPAVAFGADPVWSFEATVAEVNAWHVAWVTLLVGAALAWEDAPPEPGNEPSARVAGMGLLLGAGLAHHASSLLWSVPLAAASFPRIIRGGSRAMAVFVAAFLAPPLAGMGFLAWRAAHPGPVQWPFLGNGLGALLDHVTGAQYRHYLGRFAPSPSQAALFTSYVVPLLLLAIAALASFAIPARGAKSRGRAGPRVAPMLLVSGALQALFAFSYGVPDPVSYFLPAIAIGLAVAPRAALERLPGLRRLGVPVALAAGILLLAVLPAWIGIAVQRRVMFDRFDALVRDMWTRIPDRPGFVVWADDMSHRLRQYQLLDGLGTSLEVVNPVFLAHPVARERFRRTHGFDPLAGRTLPPTDDARATGALADTVAHALNATSPLPVYVFAPQVPSVRQLLKPPAP